MDNKCIFLSEFSDMGGNTTFCTLDSKLGSICSAEQCEQCIYRFSIEDVKKAIRKNKREMVLANIKKFSSELKDSEI